MSTSGFDKPLAGRRSPDRHLTHARSSSSSSSSSASSDRPIFLARKEEQISSGGLFDDIEYDSEDEQLLQELNAKRTPFQQRVHQAKRFFGAASACLLILAVSVWVMYGLPRWMAARTTKAWNGYTDPRIAEAAPLRNAWGKTINSEWKGSGGDGH